MPIIRNLPYLRTIPKFGAKLVEAFEDVHKLIANVGGQTNANTAGAETAPPPQVNAVNVTASGGVAHIQIVDNNAIYRGTTYHGQYSTTPGFENPCNFGGGPSRDWRIPVGTTPLYYRVFSDHPTSGHSDPVYFGGVTPTPIAATGDTQPAIPAGQGSGTGTPGQISGFGPVPFRGTAPPRRA